MIVASSIDVAIAAIYRESKLLNQAATVAINRLMIIADFRVIPKPSIGRMKNPVSNAPAIAPIVFHAYTLPDAFAVCPALCVASRTASG